MMTMNRTKWLAMLILLLTVAGGTVSAQTVYEREQYITEVKDQVVTYRVAKTHIPLSGEVKLIENARKYIIVTFRDGIMDGPYREYLHGELVAKATYREGRKKGLYEEYYGGSKGGIRKRATYANGEMNGKVTTFFSNGRTERESNYIKGKKEGEERVYSPEGREIAIKHYKGDELHGSYEETADEGNGMSVRIRRTYDRGKIHGMEITEIIDAQGKLQYRIECRYEQGKMKDRKQIPMTKS